MDRYRLSIDLERAQHEKLKDNIPHGLLAIIFRAIVDDVCIMFDKYGHNALVALVSGRISYDPLIKKFIETYEANESKDSIHRNEY